LPETRLEELYAWRAELMKRIAVLTAGASLLETYSDDFRPDYDLVFAVNEAGRHFENDYLCFIDEWIERELPNFKVPKIGYITIPERAKNLKGHYVSALRLYGEKEVLLRYFGIDTPWSTRCGYTFPCALAQLFLTDPDAEVDIYGLDFGGRSVANAKYTDDRWKFELPWVAYAWPKRARVFGNISESYLKWIAQFQEGDRLAPSGSAFESTLGGGVHPASRSRLPEVSNRSSLRFPLGSIAQAVSRSSQIDQEEGLNKVQEKA
jgi:hypothetical protein